jgi:molybdopterin converting factor small subunit
VGVARVNYSDAKISLNATQEICVLTPVSDEAIPVRWEEASEAGFSASALEKSAPRGAKFTPLPAAASKPRSYTTWEKDFVSWVYGSQRLALWRSPSLKQVSRPGESERDFRIRLQQAARERRDEAVEKLRQKYSERTATLQERLRRARQAVERETDQVRQQKAQTAISFGATLLGAFVGRRAVSATTLGRATTAARGVSRSMKEQEDVGRAQDTVESLEQRLAALEEEFSAEAAALEGKIDPQAEELESITLQPKKTGISVQLVALTWAPQHSAPGGETQASR